MMWLFLETRSLHSWPKPLNNLTGITGWLFLIFGNTAEFKICGAILIVAGAILELKDTRRK